MLRPTPYTDHLTPPAAKASGERTEVLDKRGVDRQVFAEPDGTMTAEISPEPVRAKNESGDWAPIDLTLEHVDGRLAPRNVPGDVTLSAGGDRAFAKANPSGNGTAQDIVWQWPTTLPAPVIDGATATYRDVAAGGSGDLVVIATATGFTHNVVLHEAPAADAAPVKFTIPVITPGAEISETASGALELKDTDNGAKLVTAPTPVMWDSSGTDTTDPDVEPVTTTVVNTAAGSNLVLTPSPDFLTDPDTEYPVTIDPSFTQSANGDTWIQNAEYTTSQGGSEELRAGTYDSGDHIARSYLQFPSAPFTGKDIRGASLWIRNHFSKSCTAAAINATRIIEPWSVSNLTWANRPNFTNADMGQFSTAYGADGCPADGAHWDVTEIVKGWANGTFPNYGIQLRANNETYTPSWRKYRSINYPDPDVGPRLVVNYEAPDTTPPGAPTVTSLNAAHGQYVDPLPPGHAFTLTSASDVNQFIVTRDGGQAETVTASAGQASLPWSPGFGLHRLSVVALDSAGNRSVATDIHFSVREFNELSPPLILAELTLAPNETRSTDVEALPGVSWDDVDTIVGNLEVHGWAHGQGGSVSIASGDGGFPSQPSVSWSTTQDPSDGVGSNVVAELSLVSQLVLRNTSSTSVTVKLTATGWWRFDQMTAEDEDSTEDELEQVDEAGGSGDGDLPDSGPSQTCSTTENPEIIYCETAGRAENPPPAMREAGQTAGASSGQPWPSLPSCYDETSSRTGWTTYRFRACNYSFRTGKMYLVNRSGVRKIGEWDFGVFQTVWTGHLTRKVVNKIQIKLWEARGALKGGTLTPVVQYECSYKCQPGGDTHTMDPLSLIPYQPQHWSDSVTFTSDVVIPYANYKADVRLYTSAYWRVSAVGYQAAASTKGFFPISNLIRCDNMSYFNQAPGCRLPAAEPTFVLNRRGEGVDEAAAWYKYFQENIYPWGKTSTTWFTRAEPSERRLNRRRACAGFVRSAPSKSCDEFPFAVTKQGCYTNSLRFISCKPGDVDLDHNVRAGAKLGAFLRRNRILRSEPDEQFYVRIK